MAGVAPAGGGGLWLTRDEDHAGVALAQQQAVLETSTLPSYGRCTPAAPPPAWQAVLEHSTVTDNTAGVDGGGIGLEGALLL